MLTYEIRTIEDLLKVPLERRGACMREIEYALMLHDLAAGDAPPNLEVVTWRDDGDLTVSLEQPTGEKVLTLRMKPAGG